ncbi:hypothetical protein LR48_Vigan03g201400 [Vigna angularis]|uniref:Uncharacterized protein n=1 Tax=Phaseolus angularis TaxID=3914 RepID=A0A0L9U7M6_PHAAN|nr:hypothetical protein LR48_Vigan03g201400 [Vigna angularis]
MIICKQHVQFVALLGKDQNNKGQAFSFCEEQLNVADTVGVSQAQGLPLGTPP